MLNKGGKKNTCVPPILEGLTCREQKSEELSRVEPREVKGEVVVVTSHQRQVSTDRGRMHTHAPARVECPRMKETSFELFSNILFS